MKTVAAFTLLISTSAFGHQTPFDQPDFLKMTGGDPVAAQELSMYCASTGKSLSDCKDTLTGNGSLKQEAARKCINRLINTSFRFKFDNGVEIPGSRAHPLHGKDWHTDYKKDADGVHRHAYSEQDKDRAVAQYESKLISEAILKTTGFVGSVSKTDTSSAGGGGEFGVTLPVQVLIKLEGSGSDATTKNLPLLSEAEKKRISIEKENARLNPLLGGVDPSIICIKNEKTCRDGSKRPPNESYEKDSDKETDKIEDEKKSSEMTPPHAEEDSNLDIPDNMSTASSETWAANDAPTSPDDPMIATSAEQDLALQSPMETCLEGEFTKLSNEEGVKTLNPELFDIRELHQQKAEGLFKLGYCDESYFGGAKCRAQNIMKDSVVAISIVEERKEAHEAAMKNLKLNGFCDPVALGGGFCRAQQDKWKTTPFERFESERPINPSSRPIPNPTRPFLIP